MGFITESVAIVESGQVLFIPSGSATTGVSQSFDSIGQQYVVTMSGANVSQSIIAPYDDTGSFFYLRQPDGHDLKFWFKSKLQTDYTSSTSTVEPTSSLYNLPYRYNTPSSSTIPLFIQPGLTGSMLVEQIASSILTSPVIDRVTVSSSGDYLFINNLVTGAPPSDDFNISYISGSSFTYSVPLSGSGLPTQSATIGDIDRNAANAITTGFNSNVTKYEISGPLTTTSSSFSHVDGNSPLTIKDAVFQGKAEADIFEFTNLTITTANSESYLTKHKDYTDDVPYYKLDVSDQGAMFVRIDCELNYPISRIEPPTVSSTKAHLLFLENATGEAVYISRENQTGLSLSVTDEIGFDTGDFLSPSFKETVLNVPASGVAGAIHGNVTYSSSLALDHGARLMCVRSKFDWKVQSLSDYTGTEVKFADVNATSFSGSFTGSINGGVF